MNQYNALKQALKPHLAWHGARLSFLALFLLALIKVKTVNLSELAVGFGGKALKESNYKRLQRFFRNFELDYSEIAKIVVGWLKLPQPWVLSLDRTTWELGEHCGQHPDCRHSPRRSRHSHLVVAAQEKGKLQQ